MTTKTFSFLLFFLFLNIEGMAQKSVTHQNLYWIRYYNQLVINKKITWHNEIEDRRFLDNNRQHHLIMHSRLHYKFFPNADVALGISYSLQSPQDEHAIANLVIPEIRPTQEFNYNNLLTKRFSLQQRFRIDERFIHKNDGKVLLDGYDYNFRFRYRLQANYILNNSESSKSLILKVSNEVVLNAGKNIIYNQFDQNRVALSFEKVLNRDFSAELGYIYWYQQRPSEKDFFSRNIIRLTLYHKIKL